MQHSTIPDLALLQPLDGLGETGLVHRKLLDHRLDAVVGGKGEHLGVGGARRDQVGDEIVAVEKVWEEPVTERNISVCWD